MVSGRLPQGSMYVHCTTPCTECICKSAADKCTEQTIYDFITLHSYNLKLSCVYVAHVEPSAYCWGLSCRFRAYWKLAPCLHQKLFLLTKLSMNPRLQNPHRWIKGSCGWFDNFDNNPQQYIFVYEGYKRNIILTREDKSNERPARYKTNRKDGYDEKSTMGWILGWGNGWGRNAVQQGYVKAPKQVEKEKEWLFSAPSSTPFYFPESTCRFPRR